MKSNLCMADSIGHEIKTINHIMQRKMLASADATGVDKVTVMHGWIIDFLFVNRENDVFQRDIEQEFSIARSTTTNILKLMEKKGYINRISVDSDARLKKIILTDRGLEVRKLIATVITENERKLNSVFTEEERETFMYLIRKLKKGMESF